MGRTDSDDATVAEYRSGEARAHLSSEAVCSIQWRYCGGAALARKQKIAPFLNGLSALRMRSKNVWDHAKIDENLHQCRHVQMKHQRSHPEGPPECLVVEQTMVGSLDNFKNDRNLRRQAAWKSRHSSQVRRKCRNIDVQGGGQFRASWVIY